MKEHSRLRTSFRTGTWRTAALAIFTVCYAVFFFWMTRTGFGSWFSEDDLLNTYYCWSRPTLDLLRANIFFVNSYPRPAGELIYCGGYALFGFDPVPFNVFRFVLGAANVVLLYVFVSRIARSREAGVIAVLLGGYHPALQQLFVDGGMLYDALAFFFFYSAFAIYIKWREEGHYPDTKQSVGILALNILALNSKEIAVSFPVGLLLYELTIGFSVAPGTWQLPTLWRKFRLTMLSGMVTLAFIVGKTTGPNALSALEPYRPVLSISRYLETYSNYASLFLMYVALDTIRPWLVYVLTGCIVLAALLRNRVLLWASLFNVFAILPIAFITPRTGFAFFVPLAGWVTYLAVLVACLRAKIVSGGPSVRVSSQLAVAATICVLVLPSYYAVMRDVMLPHVHEQQNFNRGLWLSLRKFLPTSVTDKRILLIHDPMKLGYASLFLIQLGYDERHVTVDTLRRFSENKQPTPALSSYDWVVDYADGKFFPANLPVITEPRVLR